MFGPAFAGKTLPDDKTLPPLKPWIILKENRAVKSTHCTCMAGLGETCSHVEATLFWMDYAVQVWGKKTVTEDKAYWKLPSNTKVTYEQVTKINYQSAKTKKENGWGHITGRSSTVKPF